MGALVFLACRDARKAAAAKAEILAAVPSALLDTSLTLDLASLASCRTFAQRFRALGIACDLLVHNGGAVIMRKSTTVDGLELAYQSNFLGSFLLTLELLPVIPSDGRIVLNSSTAAMDAQPLTAAKVRPPGHDLADALQLCSPDLLDAFEETQPLSFRRSMQMYSRSKACQVLFAQGAPAASGTLTFGRACPPLPPLRTLVDRRHRRSPRRRRLAGPSPPAGLPI